MILHMRRAGFLFAVATAACGFSIPRESVPDAPVDSPPPDVPFDGCHAVEIAASGDHTCARAADGSVSCWGRGENGELGVLPLQTRCQIATRMELCSTTPRKLAISQVTALGLGGFHSFATTSTSAYCWGLNAFGEYGNGMLVDATPTVAVAQRAGARVIDGGIFHTCSLANGSVSCSGKNTAGEVGNNMVVPESTATNVLQNATTLAAGAYSTCEIDTQKQRSCRVRNDYKQIDASQAARLSPTLVAGISDAAQVAVGVDHICVVRGDRTGICWGSNASGQLGNGQVMGGPQSQVPVGIDDLVELSAEGYHTCGRDLAGTVWCFGDGYTPTPTKVSLARPAIALTTGARHDCAVTDDGAVWCWGAQDYGQLGNGITSSSPAATPQVAALCP